MPYSPASQKAHCVRYIQQAKYKDTASYITERSATTHIAMHPELRLVV
jgi:hypothetical protein